MFVNVARRNQVLLGRQLSQLDKMEAREEDPDVLDSLFKLDHLATRMRRNAESLLVLAGIDSTRRLRSTLPMSDVIRTAVGEIEAFDRIDLSMSEDPDVSGRHALTVAHLLAELLENATHFSNPDTRVVVSASVTGHGVDVTVTDYGLGMSEDEVADANDKIAHPPVAEIAVSQRLGLFVVGRLAARLGATVELRRGRSAGTVVAVALPLSVFEGLTAPEPVVDEDVAPVFEAEVLGRSTATRCRSSRTSRPPRRSRRTTCSSPRWPPSSTRTTRTTRCPSPRHAAAACCDAAAAADNLLPMPRPARRSRSSRSSRSCRSMRSMRSTTRSFRSTSPLSSRCRSTSRCCRSSPSSSTSRTPRSSSCRPSRPRLSRSTSTSPTSRSPTSTSRSPTSRRRSPRSRSRRPPRSRPAEDCSVVDAATRPPTSRSASTSRPSRLSSWTSPSTRCSPSGRAARAEVVEPEPAPVAEVVEPEPAPVAEFVQPEPWPVAEVVEPEPQPRPAPSVPVVYAPAVDILPSRSNRPARGSRFGRHRQPVAAPVADESYAVFAPPAPPAPVSRSPHRSSRSRRPLRHRHR